MFKQFDTVDDYPDHHFANKTIKGLTSQVRRGWLKKLQQEWGILKKDLPGRALFNAIPCLPITHGIKCNDLFAFSIGCYIIWALLAGIRYSVDYIKTRRARVHVSQVWKWCTIILKSSALLSIWIFVIPVLIGLLFELLVIVPMQVPVDESPVLINTDRDIACNIRGGLRCLGKGFDVAKALTWPAVFTNRERLEVLRQRL